MGRNVREWKPNGCVKDNMVELQREIGGGENEEIYYFVCYGCTFCAWNGLFVIRHDASI